MFLLNLLGKSRTVLLGIAALVLLAGGLYACGRHDGWNAHKADEAKRTKAAEKRNASAKSQADLQRPKDQASVAQREKDLRDAYQSTPDSKPSAARVALACERLRLANPHRTLPPACGPGG